MELKLTQYNLGYITALLESRSKIKLLDTLNEGNNRIPTACIEFLHPKKDVLEKAKQILGIRKVISYKKYGERYSLILSEKMTESLLTMITPINYERRRELALDLTSYKRDNNIRSDKLTEEQRKMLDFYIEEFFKKADAY